MGDRPLEAVGARVNPQRHPIVAPLAEELREELGHMPVEHGWERAEQLKQVPAERVEARAIGPGCPFGRAICPRDRAGLRDSFRRERAQHRPGIRTAYTYVDEPGQVVNADRGIL